MRGENCAESSLSGGVNDQYAYCLVCADPACHFVATHLYLRAYSSHNPGILSFGMSKLEKEDFSAVVGIERRWVDDTSY